MNSFALFAMNGTTNINILYWVTSIRGALLATPIPTTWKRSDVNSIHKVVAHTLNLEGSWLVKIVMLTKQLEVVLPIVE